MIDLCKESISPRLSNNVLEKPKRDVITTTMLANRLAAKSDLLGVTLPSKEDMQKIFGESK